MKGLQPETREGEQRLSELMSDLLKCAQAEKRLCAMTDEEFAKVLDEHLGNIDMTTVEFEVIQNALERIRRAGGGPVPYEESTKETKT